MCGRFQLNADLDDATFVKRFNIVNFNSADLIKNNNIAPSQKISVVVKHSPNSLTTMMWGLISPWAQDKNQVIFNVRSETVFEKKMFQKMVQTQRCLIPATGFYERQKANGKKIPHYFGLAKTKLFALAGIYDVESDGENVSRQKYAILTTSANHELAPIHERMPVILRQEDEETWLNPDIVEEAELQKVFLSLQNLDLTIQSVSQPL